MVAFRFALIRGLLGLVALTCSPPVLNAAPTGRVDETLDPLFRLAREGLEHFDPGHHGSDLPLGLWDDSHGSHANLPFAPPSPTPFGVLDQTEGSFEYRPDDTVPMAGFGHYDGSNDFGSHSRFEHYHAPGSRQEFDQQASTVSHQGHVSMDAYPRYGGSSGGSGGRLLQQDFGSTSPLGAGQQTGTTGYPIESFGDLYNAFDLEQSPRRVEDPSWGQVGHQQRTNAKRQQRDDIDRRSRATLELPHLQSTRLVEPRYDQPEPNFATQRLQAKRLAPATEKQQFSTSEQERMAQIPELREKADQDALNQIGEHFRVRFPTSADFRRWIGGLPDETPEQVANYKTLEQVANYVFSAAGAVEQVTTLLARNGPKIVVNDIWPVKFATRVQQDVFLEIFKRRLKLGPLSEKAESYTMEPVEDKPLAPTSVRRWKDEAESADQPEHDGQSPLSDFNLGSYRLKVSSKAARGRKKDDYSYFMVLAFPTDPQLSPIHMGYLVTPKSDAARNLERSRARRKRLQERSALYQPSGWR